MGCGNSTIDVEMRTLVTKMNLLVQSKSMLQYQIAQLKVLEQKKKAFPDITEVKEAQIQNIKLEKEIKDTENLLLSIKGTENYDTVSLSLEETYALLKSSTEIREKEANILEQELNLEINLLSENQASLNKLKAQNVKLEEDIESFKQTEDYQKLKKYQENLENFSLGYEKNIISSDERTDNLYINDNRKLLAKSQQQIIFDINNEIQKINEEEKQLIQIIQETQIKKKILENNRNEIELRKNPFAPIE
jgi:hypothetical protein